MADDKIVKDSARDPVREALGSVRGGIRAAAKKVARKVGQKKATTRKSTTAAKSTRTAAKTAARQEKPAAARTSAPRTRTRAARTSTARSRVAAGTAAAATGAGSGSEAVALEATAATERVSDSSVAPVAPPPESGNSFEVPRPPAPVHPGAATDAMHEHAGGLSSLLALWGPLIIVGFLVLVFRGGDERANTAVATASDASERTTATASAGATRLPADGGSVEAAAMTRHPQQATGLPGAGRGMSEAFDGGFPMRTSMAGQPAFPGRVPGAGVPPGAQGRLYPSPPGPYRDPRYRGLPTGESWPADDAGQWLWPAEGPESPAYGDSGEGAVQWVRCAPPYYWCPPPSNPTW